MKDRPDYPEVLRTFEERRIVWRKANYYFQIIIQPIFRVNGIDSEKWNFILVKQNLPDHEDSQRGSEQVKKEVVFGEIEQNINDLLRKGVQRLLEDKIDNVNWTLI